MVPSAVYKGVGNFYVGRIWFCFRPCTNDRASTDIITDAFLSLCKMNHIADLLSASPVGTVLYDVLLGRVSGGQWISACHCCSTGSGESMTALNGNIGVNGVSYPPALGLNGDGRSFAVDLNLTAGLMSSPVSGALCSVGDVWWRGRGVNRKWKRHNLQSPQPCEWREYV